MITQQEQTEVMHVFKELDTTGSGKLGLEELYKGYERNVGLALPPAVFQAILDRVDTDGNGFIDYTEFLVAALNRKRLLSKEMLEGAFNAFDKDGSGAISSEELKEMLGDEATADSVWSELIQTVD
jgi:calcium-dependent protein kinase